MTGLVCVLYADKGGEVMLWLSVNYYYIEKLHTVYLLLYKPML